MRLGLLNSTALAASMLIVAAGGAQPAMAAIGGEVAPTGTGGMVSPGQTGTPTAGQQAADPAAPQSNSADATQTGLADIVVTAQRRSENLQKVAVAVSVVSADALTRNNVTQSAQLTTLVPALQVANSGTTNVFYLRGVGTFAVNAFSDPAIAFNYDGVYISRPSAATGVFYDLERVEVLKGPQGTLYGRNATGGAINVLPAKPVIGENFGQFSAVLGNYNAATLQGGANLSLGETAALRVAGTYTKHEGYQSDGTGDEDGKGARAQLLWKPSSDLTIRVGGDYYHAGGASSGSTLVGTINPFTKAISPSPYGRDVGLYDSRVSQILSGQYNFQVGRTMTGLSPYAFNDSTFWGVNADISYITPIGTFTLVPAHRDIDFNARNNITTFSSEFHERTRQNSVELRLASPDTNKLRYLVGGYYFHEETEVADSFSQQNLSNFLTGDLTTRSVAAFGRLTYAITDRLRLSGGIRYTNDRKTISGGSQLAVDVCTAPACPNGLLLPYATSLSDLVNRAGLVGPFPSPVPSFQSVYISPTSPTNIVGTSQAPLVAVQSGSKVTYRANVEYDVGARSLLYASFETGYRGGGFSFAVDPTRQQYRPETIQAWTVGSKNRFLDNRLQLNIEAFYWRYKDQQIAHLGVDSSGSQAFFTENIGTSRNFGAEVETQFLIFPHTTLSGDIQYLDAKYTSFVYKSPSPPPTRCGVSAPATAGGAYSIDCSGLQALRSPKWTLNLGIQHVIPLGQFKIVAEGSARYQTSSYVGFELLDIERQAAYWTGQASLTFASENDKFALSAFVNNIGNQRPLGDVVYNSALNAFGGAPGAPRLYGVRFQVKY
ncbi:TonB-dependent receptor [Novosphingobium humi]|uniref:TonB-dependent receptor n=1 Tax=Novosphingobium humi TaxID=2282397 RepID=A0ABY7U4E1_9SPHN|nr:TonB-dependent receptor [Novosphingobium humi]WCT79224.1 TonB-dependent receptor [Novosphingobium humi]